MASMQQRKPERGDEVAAPGPDHRLSGRRCVRVWTASGVRLGGVVFTQQMASLKNNNNTPFV